MLAQRTGRLMKAVQKAKKNSLGEIVMGFSLPNFKVAFDERPFGFSVDQDDKSGRIFVSFARGIAKDKGVQIGYTLVALDGEEVAGMSKGDVQQHMRQLSVPTTMSFQAEVADGIGSEAARAGTIVSDSEDDLEGQDAGSKRARVEEGGAKSASEARSTRAGMQTLKALSNFRFDLAKPLGIYLTRRGTWRRSFRAPRRSRSASRREAPREPWAASPSRARPTSS